MFERTSGRNVSRGAWLAVAAVGLLLPLAPGRWVECLRAAQNTLLAPSAAALASVFIRSDESPSPATVPAEVEHLRKALAEADTERERLRTALIIASAEHHEPAAQPLLVSEALGARVLGPAARGYLSRRVLVASGASDGVLPGDFVLEGARPLVDQGAAQGLAAGQLVMAAGRVWGRVATAGSQTATIERVTDVGYRDHVQLARPGAEHALLTAQGVLEGTGQGDCRLKLVKTTEPVAPGDLVVSTGGEGLLTAPLIYGEVVRVESRPGQPHWDIWIRPAARDEPREVFVLRVALNPARLAATGREEVR